MRLNILSIKSEIYVSAVEFSREQTDFQKRLNWVREKVDSLLSGGNVAQKTGAEYAKIAALMEIGAMWIWEEGFDEKNWGKNYFFHEAGTVRINALNEIRNVFHLASIEDKRAALVQLLEQELLYLKSFAGFALWGIYQYAALYANELALFD